MNFPAARNALAANRLESASHAGLIWSRGLTTLRNRDCNARPQDKEVAEQAKVRLLHNVKKAIATSRDAYKPAFARYQSSLRNLPNTQLFEATVAKNQRLLIGMGTATPLEVGLTLHHTYGVPYLPGSAIKGLAAHYASEVWGQLAEDATERAAWQIGGVNHTFVFGSQQQAGCFAFLDAWIRPDSLNAHTLADDVVTPHHRAYYGAKPEDGPIPPPADWDSPVPVSFLSVCDNIQFLGGVHSTMTPSNTLESQELNQWLALLLVLLKDALSNWGMGGKTSAGYGQCQLSEGQ